MKNISILGSTGSIGRQTLDVVDRSGGEMNVVAMSAGRNIKLFEEQVRKYKPELICVLEEGDAKNLKEMLSDIDIKIVYGLNGLREVASYDKANMVVTAVVGMIGILPTIDAIKQGKTICLANKETLVTAGHIIMPLAKENNVDILPVDSEHSAIFQCLQGEQKEDVSKLILTASGGPFRGWKKENLKDITPERALKHPNWSMGRKISIDSATMVNKGLEVIEAQWLFGMSVDDVEVVVHPQSIIHSMVEFNDGAIKAQLGTPDMRIPIQYALTYPKRYPLDMKKLSFSECKELTFEQPDMEVFTGLKLAYESARRGGNVPTMFNAANEYAVAKFLDGKIGFTDIDELIGYVMEEATFNANPNIDDILNTEKEVNEILERRVGN